MAKAKNPSFSCTPFIELSSLQYNVAKMNPAAILAPNRIPNSSGCLRKFFIDLFDRTAISYQKGFAIVPAVMASFRENPWRFCSGSSVCILLCHDLFNSTRLLVPPDEASSLQIKQGLGFCEASFLQ
ncbi:hypothetical protein HS088_TW21G01719 [Tripterygium wilfordii]|uniref:Uncharacterized protein n=1 Tax=Tripterygium wilfordii TaxID=458696 RepID=A0A7J7C624_TRIWF|nr:hypothetical protein HS088_TW21G01719 [Tripterygium wilfordii]